MEFRVEFQEVTGAISTVMELRVFGCAKGKMTISTFSSLAHFQSSPFNPQQLQCIPQLIF